MAAGSLKFVVEVAANNATQTLNAITTAVDQAGVKMKTTMLGIGEGSRAAAEGSKGLEASIKGLKGEMASGDRTINFFARSLNNIIPEASAAGQGIRLLADGLIGGIGLGFALQGIMALLTLFGERLKATSEEEKKAAEESKKAAEARYKAYEEADKKFRRLQFIRGGGTAEAFTAAEETGTAQLRVLGAEDALQAAREQFRANWAGTVPDAGTMQAKEYAAELEKIRLLEAELFRAREAAGKTVAVGVSDAEKAAGELRDRLAREREAADKAWAENIENAIAPLNFGASDLGNTTAPFRRGQSTLEWMPFVTQGGYDPEKTTDKFNESTRKAWKADDKMLADATKAGEQIGKAFAQPIVSSLEDAFAQMITGQKSFNDSMKDLWKSLAASLAKTAIGMAFSFIPGLGGLGGGLGNVIGGGVPSAAGGWSVPKGWNGLAMIHEEEVVLDRQTKRALMNGGGGNVSVAISAVDAPSLVALMHNNPEAILGPIRQARRDRRF